MATIEPNFESICIDPNDDLVLYKKEIVRSRIEKFLYAICSLDNDDLPTPLSRIEEMYKCLVMGVDFITFTPLSRAEKFVMAMLGAYDVELLPTPISRSEILMKKIATGDNNLDDIDNLQSRYEFLLAYIIKAGGFNGGSGDFYYNLTSLTSGFTTIYNTLDMPVKNAVLRGQTLVNMSSLTGVTTLKPGDVIFIENAGMKINTTYTIMFNCSNVPSTNFVEVRTMMDNTQITQVQQNVSVGYNKFTIRTNASKETNRFRFKNDTSSSTDFIFSELLILEGDYTNENIPYFEGMASVKMPVLTTVGKNLFDGEFKLSTYSSGKVIIPNGIISSVSFPYTTTANSRGICCIAQVKPNTNYTISIVDKQENTVLLGDGYNNLNDISSQKKSMLHVGSVDNANHTTFSFTTPSNCNYMIIGCYIKYSYAQSGGTITFNEPPKIQLEENSVLTSYEPYKSTTVSCNEEVELRGIGDIKDELNLVTGEYTKAIYEYTFTGNEHWEIGGGSSGGYTYFQCRLNQLPINYKYTTDVNIPIYCDKLPTVTYLDFDNRLKNVGINLTYFFRLNFSDCDSNNGAAVEDLKAYLKTNPTTIQYPISKSVKTVDLSTLDQDGKETKLKTFDDITHVTVSSEGLVPTGDIDIARPIQFVDYSLDNGLTTLYNTLEYTVKNAVLRGQTLVNLSHQKDAIEKAKNMAVKMCKDGKVSHGKKYLFIVNFEKVNDIKKIKFEAVNNGAWVTDLKWVKTNLGLNKYIIDIPADKEVNGLKLTNPDTSAESIIVKEFILLEYQDGMENWDIPYFEGMTSVKMPVLTTTGKNLFDVSRHGSLTPQPTGDIQLNSAEWGKYDVKYILKPNTQYTLTILGDGTKCWMAIFVDGSSESSNVEKSYTKTFSTNSNGEVTIGIYANSDKYVGYSRKSISIEEGTVSTPYEPHKSNILTCNEEVELRGIGDIKDELNLMTGELTQRIGEFVLDGSSDELWGIVTNASGFKRFVSRVKKTHSNYLEITNWLPTANKSYWSIDENGFYIGTNNEPVIVFNTNDSRYNMSITEFENYLSQNPLIVRYPLIESVKTVDLSVVNQAGNGILITENGDYIITENGDYIKVGTKGGKTKLKTFDDITHVIVSSEGLIPTGEITVATKDATDMIDASVMSLRMNDILNSQRTLEGSANAQSDDIDVAMLGTTDIYEQLL